MEEPAVWVTPSEIVSAIQIVALWIANGDHGQDGDHALQLVVVELKHQ